MVKHEDPEIGHKWTQLPVTNFYKESSAPFTYVANDVLLKSLRRRYENGSPKPDKYWWTSSVSAYVSPYDMHRLHGDSAAIIAIPTPTAQTVATNVEMFSMHNIIKAPTQKNTSMRAYGNCSVQTEPIDYSTRKKRRNTSPIDYSHKPSIKQENQNEIGLQLNIKQENPNEIFDQPNIMQWNMNERVTIKPVLNNTMITNNSSNNSYCNSPHCKDCQDSFSQELELNLSRSRAPHPLPQSPPPPPPPQPPQLFSPLNFTIRSPTPSSSPKYFTYRSISTPTSSTFTNPRHTDDSNSIHSYYDANYHNENKDNNNTNDKHNNFNNDDNNSINTNKLITFRPVLEPQFNNNSNNNNNYHEENNNDNDYADNEADNVVYNNKNNNKISNKNNNNININNSNTNTNRNRRKNHKGQKFNKTMSPERRQLANKRERNRVHTISESFEFVRRAVPTVSDKQKLSKLETIRAATGYIKILKKMLDDSPDEPTTLVDFVENYTNLIMRDGKARKKNK